MGDGSCLDLVFLSNEALPLWMQENKKPHVRRFCAPLVGFLTLDCQGFLFRLMPSILPCRQDLAEWSLCWQGMRQSSVLVGHICISVNILESHSVAFCPCLGTARLCANAGWKPVVGEVTCLFLVMGYTHRRPWLTLHLVFPQTDILVHIETAFVSHVCSCPVQQGWLCEGASVCCMMAHASPLLVLLQSCLHPGLPNPFLQSPSSFGRQRGYHLVISVTVFFSCL